MVFKVLYVVVETYADTRDTMGQAEWEDCGEPERHDQERQKYREDNQVDTKAAGDKPRLV